MSYRSKRLRKKLKTGEFQELCFLSWGKFDVNTAFDPDNFMDQVIHYVESKSMTVIGGSDTDGFKFYIGGNHGKRLTSADCEQFTRFMLGVPSVQSAESSELRDAWYSNLDDWYDL